MDSKRKRYNVTVEGNGQIHKNVIIAYDVEGMFWIVRKLHGHLLTDATGKNTGTISFQETELGQGKPA
ncbi:hypothetical protein ACJEBK_27240 [Peribacillus frigoritolerans]|uniref:hypothetical protein n=1 Tax=Peribacillus frigoritolerans TaxID=450367 RepID=UPI003870FBFB